MKRVHERTGSRVYMRANWPAKVCAVFRADPQPDTFRTRSTGILIFANIFFNPQVLSWVHVRLLVFFAGASGNRHC